MRELELRYGLNPNQTPAKVYSKSNQLPFAVLNGKPGYINLLDALNGWQLVKEVKAATGLAAAASFKHVSPAGVGTSVPLSSALKKICHLKNEELSDIATAYARARGADRMSSYGDFIALSDTCDLQTALMIGREVSDGIIAPGYDQEALAVLKQKKKGNYLILRMDETYEPEKSESRDVYGITFEQGRNDVAINKELLTNIPTKNQKLTEAAVRDLLIAMVTLKYTQSNSVCYVYDGQTIGVGAGQQSRVHCVRLAGNKADLWYLRQHPQVLTLPFKEGTRLVDKDNAIDTYLGEEAELLLEKKECERLFTEPPKLLTIEQKREWLNTLTEVSLGSDAFFPFGDNIERAKRSGVSYIAQAGGSVCDDHVIQTCDRYGIVMAMTGVRLFHH